MRIRPLVLLATLVVVAAVSSSACSGEGGGGGGDESPTPTPVFEADRCQIVWENDFADPSVKDVFLLDAPVAAWVLSSTHQYSFSTTGFAAAFFGELNLDTGDAVRHLVATSGAFALTLNGTEAQRALRFDDATAQPLYTVDTAGAPAAFAGTGSIGNFDGFWSDPLSQNVSAGNGTVTVVVDGTARTIGVDLSYAVCYTGSGTLFRPSHRRLR